MPLFSGQRPASLGLTSAGTLAPCPASPNAVSSDAAKSDAGHQIDPLSFDGAPGDAWARVTGAVGALPRCAIITDTGHYLHAECRSARFGFVDDLELHLRPADQLIAVRSAARLGFSDLGVNRQRVERLRETFSSRSSEDAKS